MTFHQNPFLGTFSNASDFEEALSNLDDKVFYKDGSRSMQGTLSLDNNLIIGNSILEMNHQALTPGDPIAGKLSLYSKTDKHLYTLDEDGKERQLSSGGNVDSSSTPSIDERVVIYDDTTGLLIKQDTNVVISSGSISGIQAYNQLTGLHTITGSSGITLTASTNNVALNTTVGDITLNSADELKIDTINGTDINSGGFTIASNPVISHTSGVTAVGGVPIYGDITGSTIKQSLGRISSPGVLSGLTGLTSSGIIDFNSCNVFDVSTTNNTANALSLQSSGGTSASQRMLNTTGTSSNSISIDSSVGGIQLDSATNMNINCSGGSIGIGINAIDQAINIGILGTRTINIGNTLATMILNSGVNGIRLVGGGSDKFKINSSGIGFHGSAPSAKPTITGTRSANPALADLLSDLSSIGLITDSTTEGSAGGGDVSSGSNFTDDNRITRTDTIAGVKNIQQSGIIIDDSDNISGITNFTAKSHRFEEPSGSNYFEIEAPSMASNYTITTPASASTTDRVQMLTNFNGICSWSGAADIPYPNGFIHGGLIAWINDSQIVVSPVQSSSRVGVEMNLNRSSRIISLSVSGVGGILPDSFPATNNTWYQVILIGDRDGVELTEYVLVPYLTGMNLAGYTSQRRIGWIRVNSTGDIMEFGNPDSNTADRFVLWQISELEAELLTNGSATSWTTVNLSDLIPPGCRMAYINTNLVQDAALQGFTSFRTAGLGGGTSPVTNPKAHRTFAGVDGVTTACSASNCFFINTNSAQEIEYGISNGVDAGEGTDIWVLGFIDTLA